VAFGCVLLHNLVETTYRHSRLIPRLPTHPAHPEHDDLACRRFMNKFRCEHLRKPNLTVKLTFNDGDSHFSQAPKQIDACDGEKKWLAGAGRGKSDS
jgi:hypothetical protein